MIKKTSRKGHGMKKQTLIIITTLLALAAAFAFPGQASMASSGSIKLKPASMVTLSGATGGQSVSNLWVKNQTGTQDDPTKYVTFTTPGVIYSGYRNYQIPTNIWLPSVASLQVTVNYKGPRSTTQIWSWRLYNWSLAAWTPIGNSVPVTSATTWTTLTFNVSSAAQFINSKGQIRLLVRSNNSTGDAKLDYEAITVNYNIPAAGLPTIGGCQMYPADNVWNTKIDSTTRPTLPLNSNSSNWIGSIGASTGLHMDFGSGNWDGGPIGIPYNISYSSTPKYNVSFYYPAESDAGPYPIPSNYQMEYGSDHHLLVVDSQYCKLYEIYDLTHNSNGSWSAGSGAIWDLSSDALRPDTWTSADAAGLPILPGLVRYDEILSGQINHAIRFTAPCTSSYIWPARHDATNGSCSNPPPLGARFRLKASVDISSYPADMQVLLTAMKQYGIILADNGSSWYISGVPDPRWNNDILHNLGNITGSDFEAVDESGIMVSPDSGQVTAP
jgi:hypothetical protein